MRSLQWLTISVYFTFPYRESLRFPFHYSSRMDSPAEDWHPTFWIGQHDSKRVRVTPEVLEQAHACNVSCETTDQVYREANQFPV